MKELGIAITLVSFILLSGCKDKTEPERQVVAVEKVGVDNVEIYGEYVGQIRAKGFVEVRARVEGYLEQMLFEEGKRVSIKQRLNWQKIKPKRQKPSVTWNVCAPFTSKRLPASLTLTTPWLPTRVPKRTSP